jgi:hypothetical protein
MDGAKIGGKYRRRGYMKRVAAHTRMSTLRTTLNSEGIYYGRAENDIQ